VNLEAVGKACGVCDVCGAAENVKVGVANSGAALPSDETFMGRTDARVSVLGETAKLLLL
jgi:hypothetical protein